MMSIPGRGKENDMITRTRTSCCTNKTIVKAKKDDEMRLVVQPCCAWPLSEKHSALHHYHERKFHGSASWKILYDQAFINDSERKHTATALAVNGNIINQKVNRYGSILYHIRQHLLPPCAVCDTYDNDKDAFYRSIKEYSFDKQPNLLASFEAKTLLTTAMKR